MESIKKFFKKLLKIFSMTKKDESIRSLENLEVLKRKFLEVNSCLSSTVLSPNEEIDADTKLHSLAIEISSIFGGPPWIQILADVLKTEVTEPPESLNKLLKGADLLTLVKEFQAIHLMMMAALGENAQTSLNIRLEYVAIEIANRLGGPDFVWALSTALQKNKAV